MSNTADFLLEESLDSLFEFYNSLCLIVRRWNGMAMGQRGQVRLEVECRGSMRKMMRLDVLCSWDSMSEEIVGRV